MPVCMTWHTRVALEALEQQGALELGRGAEEEVDRHSSYRIADGVDLGLGAWGVAIRLAP